MDKLWTAAEFAEWAGVPLETVYQWRRKHYGPRPLKMGRYLRYRESDIEAWVDSLGSDVA